MTGTPSRTARVSSARRNLKEAAGKLPARGTRTTYEATARWARGQIDSKPNVIQIRPAYMRRVYGRKVTRLTLRDLPSCRKAMAVARRPDGLAEVSRGHSSPLHRWSDPAYWRPKGRTWGGSLSRAFDVSRSADEQAEMPKSTRKVCGELPRMRILSTSSKPHGEAISNPRSRARHSSQEPLDGHENFLRSSLASVGRYRNATEYRVIFTNRG